MHELYLIDGMLDGGEEEEGGSPAGALALRADRPGGVLPREGRLHPRGEEGLRRLRGALGVPRVRPGQRRALRHLGRPVRARAPQAQEARGVTRGPPRLHRPPRDSAPRGRCQRLSDPDGADPTVTAVVVSQPRPAGPRRPPRRRAQPVPRPRRGPRPRPHRRRPLLPGTVDATPPDPSLAEVVEAAPSTHRVPIDVRPVDPRTPVRVAVHRALLSTSSTVRPRPSAWVLPVGARPPRRAPSSRSSTRGGAPPRPASSGPSTWTPTTRTSCARSRSAPRAAAGSSRAPRPASPTRASTTG